MDLADILKRLAEIDHEVTRLEGQRAVAQRAADTAAIGQLDAEIKHLKKATADLRDEFKRQHSR